MAVGTTAAIIGGAALGAGASALSKGKKDTTTQQAQALPEERQLNALDLALREEVQPQLIDVNKAGLSLSEQLLSGGALPGFLSGLPQGISPEVTQDIVDRSLRDVASSAQLGGFLDSGVAQQLGARTAADVRTQSEQFNIQNLMQLLNVGVGGQAQAQAGASGFGSELGGRLSGLRRIEQQAPASGGSGAFGSFLQGAGSGAGAAAGKFLFT